jgi:predicted permease
MIRDVRHALVAMRRDRQFAAASLSTLALGIGITTAVFSVVYGVLLRRLPYPDADRLVRLYEEHPGAPKQVGEPPLSNTTMYAWRDRARTVEALAGYYAREYTVLFDGDAVRVHGAEAAPALFTLLRARPQLGRFYADAEAAPTHNRFAVIGDRLWRERFAARADIAGQSLVVDGAPHVIVGVAGADLRFPDRDVQLWTPYDDPTLRDPSVQGGMWLAPTLARLRPGASIAQAEAEGTTAARSVPRPAVASMLFGNGGPVVVRVERLADLLTAQVRPALLLLGASVVFVLLIACANVANLFLSRGVARQRELAVRAALGATRGQLARQLLAESAVFAIGGGIAGLAIAWLLIRILPIVAPADFPRLDGIRVDTATLVSAALASIGSALAAGLMPAWRGARFELAPSLNPGDGSAGGGIGGDRGRRARDVLLVVESALATLLLVGAALLGRSVVALMHVDAGYDATNVLLARVYEPAGMTGDRAVRFVADVVERLRNRPQVVAAGAGNMMPFNDSTWVAGFTLPASIAGSKSSRVRTVSYLVTPGYAEALHLRLREGRLFTAADAPSDTPLQVIVNEEFVRQYMAVAPVAGRGFAGGPYKVGASQIIGVVANVLKDGNATSPLPEIYTLASAARPILNEVNIVVRTVGDPSAAAAALRAIVRDLDRGAAVGETTPLTARVSASTAQPRFAAAVLIAFAMLALVLAAVGLYGMLSYAVARRTRELGVRVALGASRGAILAMVLREGLSRMAVGALLGLAISAAGARAIGGLLFGISSFDLPAYAAAPAILAPLAAIACLAPAWRAATIDPAIALRGE